MTSYLKSLDAKAWKAVKIGWKPPTVTVDGKPVPKPEEAWTDAEEQESLRNSRALNAIHNGVDLNMFKLINSRVTAKDAWKSLEVAFEGTSKVKTSRLLLLTTKFESLRIMEEETITEYNVRVLEIANDSLILVKEFQKQS